MTVPWHVSMRYQVHLQSRLRRKFLETVLWASGNVVANFQVKEESGGQNGFRV